MENFFRKITDVVQKGIRIFLDGSARDLTLRAVGGSLLFGVAAGLIAGGSLFLPVMIGAAAFGCIVSGGVYTLASSAALSGRHDDVVPPARFKPLIGAAQATAVCGMALLGGAFVATEMREDALRNAPRPRPAAAQAFTPVASTPADTQVTVTSSASMVANLHR